MVLVVDSDPDMRQVLADSLSLLPCPVIQASTEEQALECLHRYAPVLVVTKWRMAGGGLPYLARLRKAVGACPIIVITAYGDAHTREDVLRNGGTAYFNKPVSLVEVSSVARALVSQYISSRE
jgi:DNA-binding response OmpR family regulator